MDQNWMWYLTGAIDNGGKFTVKVQENSDNYLGYTIVPIFHYNWPSELTPIFGMFEEYAEYIGFQFSIYEVTDSSTQIYVGGVNNLRRMIEPLLDGIVQQKDRVDFFLNEFIPAYEKIDDYTKENFIDLVRLKEELEQYPIESGTSRYDVQYFEEEWDMSIRL